MIHEKLIIREAAHTDFEGILPLLGQLWPDVILDVKALEKVYHNAIDSERQRLIIGQVNGKIIAFCSLTVKNNLWLAGQLGHVDELVVDRAYRGQGMGKKMMIKITELAQQSKCKRIELDSAFHRKDAHHFYETMGYENRAYLFSKTLDN